MGKVGQGFKQYRRKGLAEMRPYVPGEDLSHISVSEPDIPAEGGMVARNPENHADKWYVAEAYFLKNFELAEGHLSERIRRIGTETH